MNKLRQELLRCTIIALDVGASYYTCTALSLVTRRATGWAQKLWWPYYAWKTRRFIMKQLDELASGNSFEGVVSRRTHCDEFWARSPYQMFDERMKELRIIYQWALVYDPTIRFIQVLDHVERLALDGSYERQTIGALCNAPSHVTERLIKLTLAMREARIRREYKEEIRT